jgi:hypothetical protein
MATLSISTRPQVDATPAPRASASARGSCSEATAYGSFSRASVSSAVSVVPRTSTAMLCHTSTGKSAGSARTVRRRRTPLTYASTTSARRLLSSDAMA